MAEQDEFIRVGTTLYKIVDQPLIDGGCVKKRIAWNSETLRQDYGKDRMATVPKYDGFCTVPDHVGYKPVVGKFLNLYEPIGHRPQEGGFPCIRSVVEHIFGEQYELGMDYLQLLYLYPIQKLPILLFVSEERNTGKSTFLNFLKAIFKDNVTFNTNEDFRSQFNSDWTGKLLIMVDEVLLNRREDSERLKNLSTTLSYKVEAKGKDRNESRMWFAPKLIETEALRKIIRSNRNRLEIEMADLLLDIMAKMEVETVSFCLNDIIPLLLCSQVKAEKPQVRKVLQECWKLSPAPNGLTYTTYVYGGDGRYHTRKDVGRYYTVTKVLLESL